MAAAERLAAQAVSVEGVVDELAATVGGGSAASGVSMCQEPSTGMVKKRLNVKVAHIKKDRQSQNESTHAAAGMGESSKEFMSLDDKSLNHS